MQISLCIKFQLKLTILSFGPNLQKGYFWSETGCECEWKVNVTIELCILEVVKIIQKGYICSKTENLYTTIEF